MFTKIFTWTRVYLLVGVLASMVIGMPVQAGSLQSTTIHYVKWDAIGSNDGSSWENAYIDLQSALAAASSGDEIWVAAGTYRPTSGTDQTASFVLKDGVSLYGGFAGTESSLAERDPITNSTILSADIGVEGVASDDSLQVVTSTNSEAVSILNDFVTLDAKLEPDLASTAPSTAPSAVLNAAKPLPRPRAPALVAPRRGAMMDTLQPVMMWRDAKAHHYHIQIANTAKFETLVINSTNVLSLAFSADLLPHQIYYWRVKAFNAEGGESKWSAILNFKTPLVAPVLVAPTDGVPVLTTRPAFDWDPVTDATQYLIQVSAYDTFRRLSVSAVVKIDQYNTIRNLPPNQTLYWRVQAQAVGFKGIWSPTWSFITGNPPTVPVLSSPANNALIQVYPPLFNWKDSIAPKGTVFKHYEIQVDDSNDFSSPEIETTSDISEFTPGIELVSNTTFYWRVRAFNDVPPEEHFSGWSTARSFRTLIAPPQSLTVLPNDILPLQPGFDWDDATGTGKIKSYAIQISIDPTFKKLLVNSNVIDSTYAMRKDLPPGTIIYWRVLVNGINGPSAWTTAEFVTP